MAGGGDPETLLLQEVRGGAGAALRSPDRGLVFTELAFISILTIKRVLGKQDLLIVTSCVGSDTWVGTQRSGDENGTKRG